MKKIWLTMAMSIATLACAAQPPAANGPSANAPGAAPMQRQMAEMRALMSRMESTTDPAERRKLMDEHMQSMHRGMMMMGDMMRSPPGDGARTCADSDMSCRMGRMQAEQGAMQQRMAMMQMMMDQMMGHMMQQQGTPGAGPGPERRDGDRADPKRAP